MTRGQFLRASLAGALARTSSGQAPQLRLATFRADVTPAPGEPLIWTTPLAQVLDPLWAKGIVLESGQDRCVLCAVDWCGLGGSAHRLFQRRIALAARTASWRTAVQCVHQHTAPYVDGDAYALLGRLPDPPLRFSAQGLEQAANRIARAVSEAAARLEPFDRIGAGEAVVERVASARRIHTPDGRLLVRYSTGGRDPAMAAAPEGPIDPAVRTITFARGNTPLARVHYYATHPQTFCCDGRASADFVGAAREALEREENVFQIYFTGCAGDVTVGKYNDTSERAREELAARLLAGLRASAASTRYAPAATPRWRTTILELPPRPVEAQRARLEKPDGVRPDDLYRSAIAVAFANRKFSLQPASLEIAKIRILHLPGEPMLEFQKFARESRPDAFVAVAGYGDISPGYLCTDRAYTEGGYEPGASNAGPGTEAAVKRAIRRLLA